MLPARLVNYLEELSAHLRLDPLRERQLLREMHTHLEDRVADLRTQGRSLEERC